MFDIGLIATKRLFTSNNMYKVCFEIIERYLNSALGLTQLCDRWPFEDGEQDCQKHESFRGRSSALIVTRLRINFIEMKTVLTMTIVIGRNRMLEYLINKCAILDLSKQRRQK